MVPQILVRCILFQAGEYANAYIGNTTDSGTIKGLIPNQNTDRSIRMKRSVVSHLAKSSGYSYRLLRIKSDAFGRLPKADQKLAPVLLGGRVIASLKDVKLIRLDRHGPGWSFLSSGCSQTKLRPHFLKCPTERRREDLSGQCSQTLAVPPCTAVFKDSRERCVFQ